MKYEETRRIDQHKPKTQRNKMTTKKYEETRCMICQEEFKDNLVDESVPEHRDASSFFFRESLSELRAQVVSGKHSIFTHFPEGPKLRCLLENQNCKGILQKTYWYNRAQSGQFG